MDLTNRFDPSTALAAILSCGPESIITRTPPDLPPYLLLEALAQTCGMHLRFRRHFLVDVFLASAADLVYEEHPAPVTIRARLTGQTGAAASYEAAVESGPPCRMILGYRPALADTFFRRRFQCLSSHSSIL